MVSFELTSRGDLLLFHELSEEDLTTVLASVDVNPGDLPPAAPCKGTIGSDGSIDISEGDINEGLMEEIAFLLDARQYNIARETPFVFFSVTEDGLRLRWGMTKASDVVRLTSGGAQFLRDEAEKLSGRAWMNSKDGAPVWEESLSRSHGVISEWNGTVEATSKFGQGSKTTVRDRYVELIELLEGFSL